MTSKMTPESNSRRDFVTRSVASLSALAVVPCLSKEAAACPTAKHGKSHHSGHEQCDMAGPHLGEEFMFNPRKKLLGISNRAKQLWPVIYVDTKNLKDNVERDIERSFEGGADAVVLELGKDPAPLAKALEHARVKYPKAKIGVNYLGGDQDPYGYLTGFRLAKEIGLDIVWTDFCGVDKVQELPEISLQEIESHRIDSAFYVSGVHMKYGTLIDTNKPVEKSALQALGWVDAVIITGPKTGIPTDPQRAVRVRQAIGNYPLGAASGVSDENFHTIGANVDFCLVNTSISDAEHRIIMSKVKALRKVMG